MLCRHDSIRVKHPEYRHDSHPAFPIGAFSLLHIPSHSFRAQIQKKKKIRNRRKKKERKIENFPHKIFYSIEPSESSVRLDCCLKL